MCRSARGCRIQDIAEDTEVTRLADTFLKYRILLGNELYRNVVLDGLKSEGLADPMLLSMLEKRVQDYFKKKNKNKGSEEPSKNIKAV